MRGIRLLWSKQARRIRTFRPATGTIGDFNCIFIPNVLKFCWPYGTINRGFLFWCGLNRTGDVMARTCGGFPPLR